MLLASALVPPRVIAYSTAAFNEEGGDVAHAPAYARSERTHDSSGGCSIGSCNRR